jgi:hypothetical protein
MNKNTTIGLLLTLSLGSSLFAQNKTQDTTKRYAPPSMLPKPGVVAQKPMSPLENLEISGYYRFITNYRQLYETYSHLATNKNNIFVGDDSQIPQLMLNIKGDATSRTSFGTDLFLWTPMTGEGEKENVKGLNLGVNLSGNFVTDIGSFMVKAGGINWYALSPFTFQASKGNNRYSLFERNPWDPNTARVDSRYIDFYSAGALNQDLRWGNQAFHGLIVEGSQLPHNFSFSAMYGKTQFDGGLSAIPNNSIGGRLTKTYQGRNFIALNTFNNDSYTDSISAKRAGFNMVTTEFKHHFKKVNLYGEIGAGRRYVSNFTSKWGEAISIKISSDIKRKFPTELHLFRVSPNVLNNSSIFINSSIQQTTPTNSLTQPVLIAVSSALLPIGQMSNNRQGFELNSQINLGRLKNNIGYSNAVELENLSPKITYTHAFNNLSLSRFWRWDFPSNVGPYKNLSKIYRSVFETVYLTELNTASGKPLFKKYFNTFEINSKYKTKILRKDAYFFYLGSVNSIQNFAAPFTVFSEKALLRAYYHQFEGYVKLAPKLVWTNYLSFERIIANYNTHVDVISKRPKNQQGFSFATGADIQLSKGAGLYIRQRWMNYKDKSFSLDRYRGFETTVEVKIFF